MNARTNILMFSTADWDLPLWTNKQHTARSLRDHGFRLLYVESIGLRKPRLHSRSDGSRVVRRLARALRPPRVVEDGIYVWSPPVIPAARGRLARLFNWLVLSVLTRVWTAIYIGYKPIVWTYNPVSLAVMSLPTHEILVYHCVDDIAAQPGVDKDFIEMHEPELVRSADHVFVTSRALEAKWSNVRSVIYEPNCVDAAHFESGRGDAGSLEVIPRPIVGFVGAVAEYKLDISVLKAVAESNKSLVIVGPREDQNTEITDILARGNVYFLDARSYTDLPAIMAYFDVGIIPAKTGRYAQSMFPMKFFEYLASGVPVVATRLPALEEYSDVAEIVESSRFMNALDRVLEGEVPAVETRRLAYSKNTYAARTTRMLERLGLQEDHGIDGSL